MHELDHLKDRLRARLTGDLPPDRTRVELERVLHGRTATALRRIRANLRNEMIFAGALTAVILALALRLDVVGLKLLGGLLCVMSAVQLYLFNRQSARFQALGEAAGDLNTRLGNLVAAVDGFIRAYLGAMRWFMPACLLLGGAVGFYFGLRDDADALGMEFIEHSSERAPVLTLVVAAVVTAVLYYLAGRYLRWAIHYNYGRYLAELRNCLAELREAPDPISS